MLERKTFIEFGENDKKHTIDYLKGIIEDASVVTLKRVENISVEELHWQYAENWNTVGALLAHIIACRDFFRIYFIEGRDLTDEENTVLVPGLKMGKYIPELITGQPIEYYYKQLDAAKGRLLEAIDSLSIKDFYKKREGYNPNTGHNLAWTLYHLAEDEVHHRGQMSLIRKLYKHQTS